MLALLGGGILSDRVDRQLILLGADAVRFAAIGVVAALELVGQARMWHLVAISVIYGFGAGIAAPAFDAIVPDLVPKADLEQANALEQFIRPAMVRLAGPAVGGLLIAGVGVGWGLALDAASFLVSAICIVLMREAIQADRSVPTLDDWSLLADARAGARYVASQVWLWGTFASAAVAYLMVIGPTEVLLPYIVRETMHGSAADFGIILAAGGVGALVAAATMSAVGLPRRQLTFMYVSWGTAAIAVAGYGLAQSRWQLMVICLIINALEAAGTVAWATTKQRLIPTELLGRASSLDWFISIAGLPLSFALTAPVAALIGVRTTLLRGLDRRRFTSPPYCCRACMTLTERSPAGRTGSGTEAGMNDALANVVLGDLSAAFNARDVERMLGMFSEHRTPPTQARRSARKPRDSSS